MRKTEPANIFSIVSISRRRMAAVGVYDFSTSRPVQCTGLRLAIGCAYGCAKKIENIAKFSRLHK